MKIKLGCRIITCKTVTVQCGLEKRHNDFRYFSISIFHVQSKVDWYLALSHICILRNEKLWIQVPTFKGEETGASKILASWPSFYCKLRHSQAGHGPLSGAENSLSSQRRATVNVIYREDQPASRICPACLYCENVNLV